MTSVYDDSWSFHVDELDDNFYGHRFQSANEHKGIEVRPALLTWYPISCNNCVCQTCIWATLDNSIMDNKQGEKGFLFSWLFRC